MNIAIGLAASLLVVFAFVIIFRERMIPNAGQFINFWSVRFAALGTALLTFLTAFPDAALQSWLILPPELKSFLPQRYLQIVTIGVFLLSIFSRVVSQPKLKAKNPIKDMPE